MYKDEGENNFRRMASITWKYRFALCGTELAIRHITQKLKYGLFLPHVTLLRPFGLSCGMDHRRREPDQAARHLGGVQLFLEGRAFDPLTPCARELQPALQVGQNHVSCLQSVADGSRVGSAYSLTT